MNLLRIIRLSFHPVTIFATLCFLSGCNFSQPCSRPLGIAEEYEEQTCKKGAPQYLELSNGDERLLTNTYHNVSRNEYEAAVFQEKNRLSALYQTITTPYPGLISNQSGCPDQMKPTHHSRANLHIFTTSANATYALGICDEKNIKYDAIIGVLFCPNNKSYHLFKWFKKTTPRYPPEELLRMIHCQD